MIYDATNCAPRCAVYDVDTKERIDQVVAINAKAGWVQVAEQPLRGPGSGQQQRVQQYVEGLRKGAKIQ
mgnify:CR=1 FL=1